MKLTATLLKYGEDSSPNYFGDLITFAPGSLYTDEHQKVALLVQHNQDAPIVGYATDLWTEGDLVRGEFELLDTPAAKQVEAELTAGTRWDVSVGVYPDEETTVEIEDAEEHPLWGKPLRTTIELADLAELSLCIRGRMPSAQVDELSADDPSEGEPA